jgi:hypothetical protein
VDRTRDEDFTRAVVPLGAIRELRRQIKASSELVLGTIVTVLRPVAKRRLEETES